MTKDISRRKFIGGAVALGAGWAVLPRFARGASLPIIGDNGLWLAGDLHCHTTYSHDVYGGPNDDNTGPEDAYTFGWTPGGQITNAEVRGLDFLAITDHNDVRALTDVEYTSQKLTLIKGYEHSLARGHAGCLGVENVFNIATGTDSGAAALRDAVHTAGGIFILNHPYYSKDESQSWGYSTDVKPDSIEVWNIGWPYRGANPGVATSNNYKSIPFWESYLERWGAMPANGGSDNHYRGTSGVQGVGQPTTWVYAADRSQASILAAVAAGRTTVSAEPPALGGARAFITARAGSTEYMVGDTAPANTPLDVSVRVVGAPGQMLKLFVDGVGLDPIPVASHDFTSTVTLNPAKRVRAEVYVDEGYWMSAITSPIYVG